MAQDDETPTGIKSFSVGLGDGTPLPQDRQPPPPYRVLIFGDFATSVAGLLEITGKDISELISELSPALTVEAQNILGTLPATLIEDVSFKRPRDFKPAAVSKALEFRTTIKTAMAMGSVSGLADHGQRFDLLLDAAKSSSANAAPEMTASGDAAPKPQTSASPSSDSKSDEDDGLDGLFSMVEPPKRSADSEATQDLAKHAVQAFLSQTSSGEPRKSAPPTPAPAGGGASFNAMIEDQAALVIKDHRLHQVLENWLALRMLLAELPRESSIRLFLVQVSATAAIEDVLASLEEPEGALAHAAFDVVLAANESSLAKDGASGFKRLATVAVDNATCLLGTLTPDFAGESADTVGSRDTPHQMLDQIGFEQFASLRQSPASSSLALFWNKGRLIADDDGPADVGLPASWVALLSILHAQAANGWPDFGAGKKLSIDQLETAEHTTTGKPVADSVMTFVSQDSALSLASAGINVLRGQANRAEVYFAGSRTVSASKSDEPDAGVARALSMARLNTLLQVAFSTAPSGSKTAEESANNLQARLDEISDALFNAVQFSVSAARSEEDEDVLDIDATLTGSARGDRHFGFRIGI
jgi:hypothetical protein